MEGGRRGDPGGYVSLAGGGSLFVLRAGRASLNLSLEGDECGQVKRTRTDVEGGEGEQELNQLGGAGYRSADKKPVHTSTRNEEGGEKWLVLLYHRRCYYCRRIVIPAPTTMAMPHKNKDKGKIVYLYVTRPPAISCQ